jgi:hypothetical protein
MLSKNWPFSSDDSSKYSNETYIPLSKNDYDIDLINLINGILEIDQKKRFYFDKIDNEIQSLKKKLF